MAISEMFGSRVRLGRHTRFRPIAQPPRQWRGRTTQWHRRSRQRRPDRGPNLCIYRAGHFQATAERILSAATNDSLSESHL